MNFAKELEKLRARGFDEERAQMVLLVRETAVLLFRTFPQALVLYGGANLILFHNSLRISRDLDLLAQGGWQPKAEEVREAVAEGLREMGELLGLGMLRVHNNVEREAFCKLEVTNAAGATLFTIDVGGLGTVLPTGIEERELEALSQDAKATVRLVSRDHLLLQKAEAFAFRRAVKARDAYDIRLLLDNGARLSGTLQEHLGDALAMREMGREQLAERVEQVNDRLCRSQLEDVLPRGEYEELRRAGFAPLRAALQELFGKWL